MVLKNEVTNWVFVRGLGRGSYHWLEFRKHLDPLDSNYNFLFPEIAGCGSRWNENTPTNPIKIIEDLNHQINLQSDSKFNIFAISLGGMIALKWCELFPKNIQKIVIVNSSLQSLSPFYKRLKAKNYFSILKVLLIQNILKREKLILDLTVNNKDLKKKVLSDFTSYAKKNPFQVYNFYRQIILANKIHINFEKINNKEVTILTSKNDRLVDYSCSFQISQKLMTDVKIHETAGHDISIDDPNWLTQFIRSN